MLFWGSGNYVSLIYSFGFTKYAYLLLKKNAFYPFPLLYPDNCQTIFKTTYSMEIGDTSDKLIFEIEN